MNSIFNLIIIIYGIMFIMMGFMIKQQKLIGWHFGIRKVNVDIPNFTQFIWKFDCLFGLGYIVSGLIPIIFNTNSIPFLILLLIVTIIVEIYAERKFKVK